MRFLYDADFDAAFFAWISGLAATIKLCCRSRSRYFGSLHISFMASDNRRLVSSLTIFPLWIAPTFALYSGVLSKLPGSPAVLFMLYPRFPKGLHVSK